MLQGTFDRKFHDCCVIQVALGRPHVQKVQIVPPDFTYTVYAVHLAVILIWRI